MKTRKALLFLLAGLTIFAGGACTPGRYPPLEKTEFPGLYVPKKTYKTVRERIPGHGRWVMTVNEGEGQAYFPEDGRVAAYGYEGEGRPTASGEIFDPDAMTAAHRSLPLHTVVRITRVDLGESVVVRINDRSAEVEGRVIEVTPKVAHKLDLDEVGAAPCRVEVLRYPTVEPTRLAPETAAY